MSELNGNIPMLGPRKKMKSPVGPPIALVRTLDENCLFEPEAVQLVNGQPMGISGRSNLVTAEDLCDMILDALIPSIKVVIREELKKAKQDVL